MEILFIILYNSLMNFYDILSTFLTLIGTTVLVYRTVQELEVGTKSATLQKMCTKWVIFIIFLKLEYIILAVIQIIPLGALALLVVKFLLFMPQNPISHKIYKYVQRKLQKVKMDEYSTQFGKYLSIICKQIVILMMKGVQRLAEYVNSHDIEVVEAKIVDVVKIFQYKKAAINMRSQVVKSQITREDLNDSEMNTSASEDQILPFLPVPKEAGLSPARKTQTAARMSKILEDVQADEDKDIMKLKAQLMVVKPNKHLGTKAVYENVKIQFYVTTKKITFENKNKAVETGTLKQIKWITKNMINIELILQQGRSKVIKLTQKADVAKWVEPICDIIEKNKSKVK